MNANDDSFQDRREQAKLRLDKLTGAVGGNPDERGEWFHNVYESAAQDAAQVPWATLAPHPLLADWLENPANEVGTRSGATKTALDIACGLGDNAEAFAARGWNVTAFDLVPRAIQWARGRFPASSVDYQVADLFHAPANWRNQFDLVHECYTLQALHGAARDSAFATIAQFVRPAGLLLVIARTRESDEMADGPPWPLSPAERNRFWDLGFENVDETMADVNKPDGRVVPHCRMLWRKRLPDPVLHVR